MIFDIVLGDMLIFMPGQEDIEVTCDLLSGKICIVIHNSPTSLI